MSDDYVILWALQLFIAVLNILCIYLSKVPQDICKSFSNWRKSRNEVERASELYRQETAKILAEDALREAADRRGYR